MVTTVTDWGEAIMTSLAAGLAMMFAAIPKIIGFVLIVAIGWFVSGLVAKLAAAVLRKIKTDELAERAGFADFIRSMGLKCDAAGFLAGLAKWFMRLVVLVVAFDALGLPAVSDVLRQVLLWLPNLAVALAVLIVGGLVAKAFSRLIYGSMTKAGIGNPQIMATIASTAVWAFAIIVAANQVGIAQTLVNTLFIGTVAMLVLALGLSFGLGAKDTAAEIVRKWYGDVQNAKPKLERAADEASRQATQTQLQGSARSDLARTQV
jgi:Mechanosensitive ion channel, conserved TM helix